MDFKEFRQKHHWKIMFAWNISFLLMAVFMTDLFMTEAHESAHAQVAKYYGDDKPVIHLRPMWMTSWVDVNTTKINNMEAYTNLQAMNEIVGYTLIAFADSIAFLWGFNQLLNAKI